MLEFQAGDDGAFERIVSHHGSLVEHFVHRYLDDRGRAEDLTQEVFVRVFRSRARYVPSAGFKTWLFTIATRLALNEIRGLRRRRRVFASATEVGPSDDSPWDNRMDPREPSPHAQVEKKELEGIVDRLMDDLPPNQKAALLLSRVENLSYREIAAALEVSVMAAKSLLMRARETLRQRLEPYLSTGRLAAKSAAPLEDCGPRPGRAL
ncbi:MAG: sigma-70 family RNA polymerase sigma factor [Planctomycetota bacterium]|nr:sigma-70 family RNA polymerase sigma factor [Planctomycetota bacterium]